MKMAFFQLYSLFIERYLRSGKNEIKVVRWTWYWRFRWSNYYLNPSRHWNDTWRHRHHVIPADHVIPVYHVISTYHVILVYHVIPAYRVISVYRVILVYHVIPADHLISVYHVILADHVRSYHHHIKTRIKQRWYDHTIGHRAGLLITWSYFWPRAVCAELITWSQMSRDNYNKNDTQRQHLSL